MSPERRTCPGFAPVRCSCEAALPTLRGCFDVPAELPVSAPDQFGLEGFERLSTARLAMVREPMAQNGSIITIISREVIWPFSKQLLLSVPVLPGLQRCSCFGDLRQLRVMDCGCERHWLVRAAQGLIRRRPFAPDFLLLSAVGMMSASVRLRSARRTKWTEDLDLDFCGRSQSEEYPKAPNS